MEDNPKLMEKGFFRWLWVIFGRSLANGSFLTKVPYFSSMPMKVLYFSSAWCGRQKLTFQKTKNATA
jgi:hypothetical protein